MRDIKKCRARWGQTGKSLDQTDDPGFLVDGLQGLWSASFSPHGIEGKARWRASAISGIGLHLPREHAMIRASRRPGQNPADPRSPTMSRCTRAGDLTDGKASR